MYSNLKPMDRYILKYWDKTKTSDDCIFDKSFAFDDSDITSKRKTYLEAVEHGNKLEKSGFFIKHGFSASIYEEESGIEIWCSETTFKVEIKKTVHRIKRPYCRRYNDRTIYELTINGHSIQKITIGIRFKSIKSYLKYAQEKFKFTEYKIFDMGMYHRNAQLL